MKRRYIFISLCAFLFLSASLSQNNGWVMAAKPSTGLRTIFFIDSLHGWAASSVSAIQRTTDGGITWMAYPGDKEAFSVLSISFADTLNGWCVGWDGSTGYIIHTTDGGKTWKDQHRAPWRKYSFTQAFSSLKNIIAGNSTYSVNPDTGIIIQTEDGGSTWAESTPDDRNTEYHKIQFLDSLNGFLWGNLGLRTRDGGNTWRALPKDNRILSPSFIDTLRGWGGYQYLMFHTTNGGLSWEFQSYLDIPEQLTSQKVQFVDSLNGWAFGYQFYQGVISDAIYRTADGGRNWYREEVGLSKSISDGEILDAQMMNVRRGWAVCTNGSILIYEPFTSVVNRIPDRQPTSFVLHQNYPNPFNPSTTIEYDLQKRQIVTMIISDVLGRKVKTVLPSTLQESGVYRLTIDGRSLSSGVYYYTITTDLFTDTKTMIVIK